MDYSKVPTDRTPVEKHRFTWKIPNFAQVRSSPDKVPHYRFVMGSSIDLPSKWKCYMCFNSSYDMIGIFVELLDKINDVSELPISLSMKIDGGKYFNGCGTALRDMLKASGWGYSNAIKKVDTSELSLPLNPDGSLSIDMVINLYNFTLEATLEASLVKLKTQFDTKFYQKLHSDLESMYENPGTYSAVPSLVTVVSSDDKDFVVNPGILAARSAVFKCMFQTAMSETLQGVVKMDDMSGVALDALLRFVVTGKLPGNWSDVGILEQLTYAAHKFLLEDLMEFLDLALGLVCTKQNCGKLLNLAEKLNMKQAEKDLFPVVKRHLLNGDWKEIKQCLKDME